ncbi:hypothetical protein HAX54_018044, partial [Datura stramonium]|nr:hypothetical protein [Datura stramonium]
ERWRALNVRRSYPYLEKDVRISSTLCWRNLEEDAESTHVVHPVGILKHIQAITVKWQQAAAINNHLVCLAISELESTILKEIIHLVRCKEAR